MYPFTSGMELCFFFSVHDGDQIHSQRREYQFLMIILSLFYSLYQVQPPPGNRIPLRAAGGQETATLSLAL